jgi:oxygen-independent coproporphyrinogen-3 oxidase
VWPVRHLYVHIPFCAHRCGYCDFVTVTGKDDRHERYVTALIAELEAHRGILASRLESVYLGGGTPTMLAVPLLARLLAALPGAEERSIECNPETVMPELAELLAGEHMRVSLGAQSFQPELLAVLERRATAECVRGSVLLLRAAGVGDLSLDLIHGIPGQGRAALDDDIDQLLALAPDHCSAYELEAKPGTRFTHRHGPELARQAALVEDHYERLIDRLETAGYRWYETANFCRPGRESRHNRAYWTGRDYLGIGVGAVSTLGDERRTNLPRLDAYLDGVLAGGHAPHRVEHVDPATRLRERLMLGLRLEEGVAMATVAEVVDPAALEQLRGAGIVRLEEGRIVLERRGRLVADDVVARLLT